ncbi:TSUP family transporter [Endozoicomonas numazuensis]|uniref:Probable membrane transporter protein n=1 Tax=Endozoicomonas numazuensis TaxID=1137799 RepID=A0A081NK68_9GAMM|nr:TSUP family transporter [Endozoicomonas numazuensis]KEQ18841.1 membrane protein [Endozoicomonas numazuensis]
MLTLDWAILLFFVAALAGFVDSIAGGGGLITVPALLAVGLSPAQALATNKLQGTGGTFSASVYFVRRGLVNLKEMRFAIIMTFFGSAVGTVLVQMMDASVLKQIIPFLLLGIAAYFILSPSARNEKATTARMSLAAFAGTAALGVGFYDGFFGPGTGSFFAIAFVSLLGYSLTKATAHTKVLNCTSNVASLLFFILGGQVVWAVGGIMLIGQFLGARLGSRMVVKRGQQIIRPMIVVISLVMTGKLMWDEYSYLLF